MTAASASAAAVKGEASSQFPQRIEAQSEVTVYPRALQLRPRPLIMPGGSPLSVRKLLERFEQNLALQQQS